MNPDNDEKILIEAGLSEEQAAIYSALLDKGPLKAGAIASWTGIKRGLIYKVLDQLENMGLVSKKGGVGTVAVFAPEHPSHLSEMMERKEKLLALAKETVSFSLGALSSKFNLLSGKPNVQFYEGKDGIKKVLEDTLMVPSGTEIYTYADIEAITKYIPEINKDYSNKRESLKIKKKGLVLDTVKAREIIKDYHTEVTETKFIKSDTGEFETVIQIYENKISYITLKNDSMIGVIIEDSSIYKIHKAIFETLWGLTPEVN
jgi:sugar-specific transcriptional regulator TrmB